MAMNTFDLLIVNGIVVTAEEVQEADLAINGEKIVTIRQRGGFADAIAGRTIDAEGGCVMPGGIVSLDSNLTLYTTELQLMVRSYTGRPCPPSRTATVWKRLVCRHFRDRDKSCYMWRNDDDYRYRFPLFLNRMILIPNSLRAPIQDRKQSPLSPLIHSRQSSRLLLL